MQYLILKILLELLKVTKTTACELANKMEVSQRTVYRYLTRLESAGVPIVTKAGKNGFVALDQQYKLTNFYLTQEEKQLIKNCLNESCNMPKDVASYIIAKLNI